ncbi:thiamine pyrophosphokinase [Pluteus cervinus]|uniref:Thiamine pyrophosphokinase n=1 Tax=Pluteus cervinus TaxID=181527 RepID=A0ACD3B4U6_9AGAR|nr:thiamine pyrophosphokinase [Pluteus cervinus]
MTNTYDLTFLHPAHATEVKRALIILNQPFSYRLLLRLWKTCQWRSCADGGANRLYDILDEADRPGFGPDLIKGDLDSLREDVRRYYESQAVPVIHDHDQNSTDLMKCVAAVREVEGRESCEVSQYEIVILGGLSGRLDQTIHTLSYLHKLRHSRKRVYVVTDESIGWVLDGGEHRIRIDHQILGPTCGLLPVGIASTILTTSGLRWNLTNHESSFEGLVSTSNQLIPGEDVVFVKTSAPIWWCIELRGLE